MLRTTDEMRRMAWTGSADGRTGEQADGGADGRIGRTVEDGFPKGKTPKLTRQLTWPSEIQRGRPQVTVQLRHLPPPSR